MKNSQSLHSIYRSERYGIVCGLCAGIALARGWSVSVVRAVALLCIPTGIGLLAYLIAWILVPSSNQAPEFDDRPLPDTVFRSRSSRVLGGVCGGLAKAYGLDVGLLRVVFVVFVLCAGFGVLPYLYFWIAVPLEPSSQ
jgi:phage shock protein C